MRADLLRLTPYFEVTSHPLPIQFRAYFLGFRFYVALQHLGDGASPRKRSAGSNTEKL